MSYFTEEQVGLLLKPIHPHRVLQRDGMSYVEGYDIRAELNRVFGFGRWDTEILDQALVCETQTKTKTYTDKTGNQSGGKDAWYVVYRSRLRLIIKAPDGTRLAHYDGTHVGESTHPVRGEAHGNAVTNSETYALRRCAINLGDQFGLSLYNKGSMAALVRWTLVRPAAEAPADTDDVPQVAAESDGTPAHETGEPPQPSQPRASRPATQPASAEETDEAAQELADQAHEARTIGDLRGTWKRSADAKKLNAVVCDPASGEKMHLVQLIDSRRRELEEVDAALKEFQAAAEARHMTPQDMEAHVKRVTGTDFEAASAVQLRQAAAALSEGAAA